MKKSELVFIPSPGLSHLVSAVETAKLLLNRNPSLSTTVLTMKFANDRVVDDYTTTLSASTPSSRLRLIPLPAQHPSPPGTPPLSVFFQYIDSLTNPIREIISNLIKNPTSRLSGLVLDMFCTGFVDIASEFGVPSYVFFTSGASCLGLFLHLVSLKFDHDQDLTRFKNADTELHVPCFSNPVPAKVIPAVLVEDGAISSMFMNYFRRMKEAQGILVNTFYELESFALESMGSDPGIPRVYPLGPILNLENQKGSSDDEIREWLDEQPENSVVFLCFGSMGSFRQSQVIEIAAALENAGTRFLWSLRKPPEKGGTPLPSEYEDFEEVLPEGFLNRTKGMGKVIGWAPQTAVLAHPAVGGFVSHCGWNSTLESVWFGVPVATFPLSAEQQLNAFQLVREMEMAEAIRIDYHYNAAGSSPAEMVKAEEIEGAIRRLMGGGAVREKVKEMQRKSRLALQEGGSSYSALNLFIHNVLREV